jgi:hypothetical protein
MNDLSQKSDFLFYNSEDGSITVQVIVGDDTVWVSAKGMAEIFGIDRSGIIKHIQNIYETGELVETATCAKIAQVQIEGGREVTRTIDFYNLDVIIAVGYRVNSYNATKFRIWATKVLKEYLIKGFAMDDERLKQGNSLFNKDYFKELLDRIRDIRASERMFYEQVRDIFATSVDYDKKSEEAITFFATIQNKLEYAVTGKTAAELIKSRANALLPHMNLQTWKNVKSGGDIQKMDVTIAKNYLLEPELSTLKLLVNMFLDFAELQAQRNKLMKMADWIERIDSFLKFNDYQELTHPGTVRKDVADAFAKGEYYKYKVIQVGNNSNAFNEMLQGVKQTGKLPSETPKEENTFDKQLKGLLRVPPPPKKDKNEKKAN